MSASLPVSDPCCISSCDDVLVQNVPGPQGESGTNGTNGTDGISAVTTLTVAFTMPAEGATAVATMATTAGLVIGENVFVQGLGTLEVTAIGSAVLATLENVEDTAAGTYASNAAPGTIAAIGSRVGMTGLQGQAGIVAGTAAGGDLKGTYVNPKLAIPNALGALVVGNGTDAVSLAAGTAGFVPVNDAATFPATGIGHKKILPVTGDANVATDRLARLSAGTGLPIPLTASKASLKDPGGAGLFVADATAGNARGTDAVDLQVNRATTGATGVASGVQSVLGGGRDNTASGARAVVSGGEFNLASGQESTIGGGSANQADSTQSTIGGGDRNTILGGVANESTIGGGNTNAITGNGQAVIAGGIGNTISAQYGAILGGATNIVSADYASVVGGGSNTVSGFSGSIVGGSEALADKYAQRAYAGGRFAAKGDAQTSELVWRISTTGIVGATEMFLDGNSLRATIAAGRTVAFEILITARSSAGLNAAWTVKGVINNLAGVTSIATAVVNALIADNSGASFGTLANVPVVFADNANDALAITVANPAATNVRWLAHARLVEIGY